MTDSFWSSHFLISFRASSEYIDNRRLMTRDEEMISLKYSIFNRVMKSWISNWENDQLFAIIHHSNNSSNSFCDIVKDGVVLRKPQISKICEFAVVTVSDSESLWWKIQCLIMMKMIFWSVNWEWMYSFRHILQMIKARFSTISTASL